MGYILMPQAPDICSELVDMGDLAVCVSVQMLNKDWFLIHFNDGMLQFIANTALCVSWIINTHTIRNAITSVGDNVIINVPFLTTQHIKVLIWMRARY